MRLWELFEDLSYQEVKDMQHVLNKMLFMPPEAVKAGGNVLKLDFSKHFIDRATGDLQGRDRPTDINQFDGKQIRQLFIKAKHDKSLGYANDLAKFASWEGPGDYPPGDKDSGYQIKDPDTRLRIPVVVKPNPNAKRLISKTTVATDRGIEPRNVLRAKTIYTDRPDQKGPKDAPNQVATKASPDTTAANAPVKKPSFSNPKPRYAPSITRAPRPPKDTDDGM